MVALIIIGGGAAVLTAAVMVLRAKSTKASVTGAGGSVVSEPRKTPESEK